MNSQLSELLEYICEEGLLPEFDKEDDNYIVRCYVDGSFVPWVDKKVIFVSGSFEECLKMIKDKYETNTRKT